MRSERIIRAAAGVLPVSPDTVIVEIGPGKGALTGHLLGRGVPVIAVEKDPALAETLRTRFADAAEGGNLVIIRGDARDTPWLDAAHGGVRGREYIIVANIPYYLTGSLIRTVLTCEHPPSAMALIVQKEVAERITARDGRESLLSLSVRLFGTPTYRMKISRSVFRPVPAVDSALITVTDIHAPPQPVRDAFFSVIRRAFAEKRKMVLKKFADRPDIQEVLRTHGVTETARAEEVPFPVWFAAARSVPTRSAAEV